MAQDAQLGAETREALGSVLEEVDRLAEIVEGLFALSRLDAGEAHAEWVRFDLAELAATTADQMSLLAEDKQVSVACDSAAGVTVEGDRARLKQVVVNLLDNAIKYTPRGGRVSLRPCGARAATRCSTSPTTASASPPRRSACVQALLPRGWLALARAGRRRPRAVDRQVDLRGPRRPGRGAQRSGRGQHVPHPPAARERATEQSST